jgi:hypothetical protein
MTEKKKEFTLAFICVLLGVVVSEISKGTAIHEIIIVVSVLVLITIFTILFVKCLGEKEWGRSALSAAITGILAYVVWGKLSHCPWRQLSEEIDKVLNVLTKIIK